LDILEPASWTPVREPDPFFGNWISFFDEEWGEDEEETPGWASWAFAVV
jgi:hypothetical protein